MKKDYLKAISRGFFLLGSAYCLITSIIFLVFGPIQTKGLGIKITLSSLINPWQISLFFLIVGWIVSKLDHRMNPDRSFHPPSTTKFKGHPSPQKLFILGDNRNGPNLRKQIREFSPYLDRSSTLVAGLFLLVLWGYGSHLLHYKSTAVTGCDTYGYLQGSVLMAQKGIGHTEMKDPLLPRIFQKYRNTPKPEEVVFFLSPHGHYVYDWLEGLVYNVFPPGVSWILLPFIKLGTLHTAFYVLPILNLLAVFLFFYLWAKRVDSFFGFAFISFTFFNFIVFQNTIAIMSDLPSMVLVALSIFLLCANLEKNNRLLPLGAGLLFGLAWTIRYSNLVGIVPIFFLFMMKFSKNKSWRDLFHEIFLFLLTVFVFGIIPMALYTRQHFGTIFALVYEPYTRSRMAWENLPDGATYYLTSLYENFGLLGFVMVLLGFISTLFNQKRRLVGLVGLIVFISFFLFYSFHSIRHARYLMPVFPFLGICYALGVLWIGERFNQEKAVKIMILLLLATYPLVEYASKPFYPGDFTQEKASQLLKTQVEDKAVIFCDLMSGPIKLYSGLTGYRFYWTNSNVFVETMNILKSLQRPIYFYLDSETAKDHFENLVSGGIIKKENLKLVSEIQGIPLFQLSYPSPPEQKSISSSAY